MKFPKKILIKLSGPKLVQGLLEKNILISQHLLGIGSGTSVGSSGEKVLIKLLMDLKIPEVVVFDVGANQGQFSEMITAGLKDKINFRLHSFEPSVYSFKKLAERIKSAENVSLNNFALGKREGEAELYYDKEGSGLASLTKRELDHFNIDFNGSEKITVKTLDNYCSSQNIKKIDLLKIDVEGHELDVLEGAAQMFEHGGIRIVSFEFGGCNIDTRTYFRDFFNFFKNKRMEIHRITPSGNLIPVPHYREIHEQFRTTNFLALPHG